jgi:hypothetical protein
MKLLTKLLAHAACNPLPIHTVSGMADERRTTWRQKRAER